MNILFISNHFPPLVDGVGDYTYNLAKEFVAHGHNAFVVCSQNQIISAGEHDGILVYPIVTKWNKNASKTIVHIAKLHDVDIVSLQYVPYGFSTNGLPFSIARLAYILNKNRIPLFTFFHEVCIGRGKWYHFKRNLGASLMAFISQRVARKSSIVATSIEHYRKRLNGLKIDKVAVIPIPSNIPFKRLSEEQYYAFRKNLAEADETIIILFGHRDFSTAMVGIQRLVDKGMKIKVIALGNADKSIPLDKKYILFTGTKNLYEIADYMYVADFLILPENVISGCSLKSGSLAAAIQFGIPTITMRGFMTDEKLNELFLFVENECPDEYERLFLQLINDEGVCIKLKEKCMEFAKRLTWASTYDQYIAIMDSTLLYKKIICK